MRILLFILLLSPLPAQLCTTYSRTNYRMEKEVDMYGAEFLIPQAEFDDTNYTLSETFNFLNYLKSPLSPSKVSNIHWNSKYWKINILVILTKLECENNLITYYNISNSVIARDREAWAMGYGVYVPPASNGAVKPFYGWDSQLWYACQFLRTESDSFPKGSLIRINANTKKIVPRNGATYALYRYTPFWGLFKEHSYTRAGNEAFVKVYRNFRSIWYELRYENLKK